MYKVVLYFYTYEKCYSELLNPAGEKLEYNRHNFVQSSYIRGTTDIIDQYLNEYGLEMCGDSVWEHHAEYDREVIPCKLMN